MSGPFGKDFDKLLLTSGIGHFSAAQSSHTSAKQKADIAAFVEDCEEEALFSFIPGRHHKGFDSFTYPQAIRNPEKMGQTIKRLAFEIDLWDHKEYT